MTTFHGIVAVLSALYLAEIHHWLPPWALLFRPGAAGHYLAVSGSEAGFPWGSSAMVVRGALFPWSPVVVVEPRPFRLDGDRVRPGPGFALWPQPPPSQTEAIALSTEQLPTSDQAKLVFGGGQTLSTSSEEAARAFAEALRRLAPLDAEARVAALRAWDAERADPDAIARALDELRTETRILAIPCTALFLLVFGVAIAMVLQLWAVTSWSLIGGAYLVILAFILLVFVSLHRDRAPDAVQARWVAALSMVVNPAAAMTAVQTLGRSWLAGHEPLAVSRALLSPEDYARFEDRYLRSRRFGSQLCVDDSGPVGDDFATPPRHDGSVCFCPRCLAQYSTQLPECTDCPGVATAQFC